jgi:glycosyltransferase involved in cell wall biosynthesis
LTTRVQPEGLEDVTTNRTIAVFSPTLQAGGSEHVLGLLVKRLYERGQAVERVIAHQPLTPGIEDENGAMVRGLGAKRMLGAIRPLTKYLVTHRPQCILSSLTYANILVIASAMLAGAGTPVIVREATTVTAYARISQSRRNSLLPMLVRRFYRHADQVIAVSQGVRDDLVDKLDVPSAKVRVIYNPVDLERVKRLAEQDLSHPWFCEPDCPVVVTVARLDESKDFDSLLSAVQRVNRTRAVRFVVVGEGPERSRIESLARHFEVADRIWLAGYQENPYRFVARADVFLHPSKVEGLPNAVLEALALERPIVSSDCDSGPREILLGGRYGSLVPVGDADAMAAAILEKLETGATHTVDADFMTRFGIDHVVDAYLATFAEVAQLGGGGHSDAGARA